MRATPRDQGHRSYSVSNRDKDDESDDAEDDLKSYREWLETNVINRKTDDDDDDDELDEEEEEDESSEEELDEDHKGCPCNSEYCLSRIASTQQGQGQGADSVSNGDEGMGREALDETYVDEKLCGVNDMTFRDGYTIRIT